jgi:hypothetical protein
LVVFIHPHYGVDSSAWGDKDNGHVLPLALGFPFETTTVRDPNSRSNLPLNGTQRQQLALSSQASLTNSQIFACCLHTQEVLCLHSPPESHPASITIPVWHRG